MLLIRCFCSCIWALNWIKEIACARACNRWKTSAFLLLLFLWISHVLTSLSELRDAVGFSQVIRHHAAIMTLLQGLQKATQVLFASSVIIQFTFQKSTVSNSWVFCWGIYADDSLRAYHALLGKYESAIHTGNMLFLCPYEDKGMKNNSHLFYLSLIFRFPLWGETHVWPRGTLGMWRLTVREHGL